MLNDPFSDILKFTDAETVVSGGFITGGRWAIHFPRMEKVKFSAVIRGSCWLCVEGDQSPVRVEAGDILLLSTQQPFVLASDLQVRPAEAASIFSHNDDNSFVKFGAADEFFQIGGFVRLNPVNGGLLADVLPSLIQVKAASSQAPVLHWLVEQLVQEQAAKKPGAALVSAQLAQILFVQIVRMYLETTSGQLTSGLLRALSDPLIAPALNLMHSDPGCAWHLEQLAQACAMSRTTFAIHFKQAAGVTPLAYLTKWRMCLAERALREEDGSVSEIAQSLGYTSESAFCNAFKLAFMKSPQRYRSTIRLNK